MATPVATKTSASGRTFLGGPAAGLRERAARKATSPASRKTPMDRRRASVAAIPRSSSRPRNAASAARPGSPAARKASASGIRLDLPQAVLCCPKKVLAHETEELVGEDDLETTTESGRQSVDQVSRVLQIVSERVDR